MEAGKFVLALLVALALCFSVASTASADLTVSALAVASTGALTLTGAVGSAINLGTTVTTGAVVIGGPAATGDMTFGASTGAGQTVNIGSGATTGSDIVNIGTGTATTMKTVNIATGAISTVNIGTGNFVNTIAIGTHATPINVITLGGAASTLSIGATLLGASPLVFEGATADAFETTIAIVDPTADQTISVPNNGAASALLTTSLTTNAVDIANAVTGASSAILFEGATADAFETSLTLTDPTADRTVTIPDRTGQVQMASAISVITAGATPTLTVGLSNLYTDTPTDNQDQTITFSGAGTAGDMLTIVFIAIGTADEVITFQTTLVNSVGTLTLSTTAADRYTVTFMSDGTVWNEIARTAVQT
jgi:hypothetical protein